MQAAPTAAETICSVLVRPGLTTLAVEDHAPLVQPQLQHPLDSGALALLLPATAPRLPGALPTALLEVTDHLVLGASTPVRSVVWLAGHLETMPVTCQRLLGVEIAEHRPHEGLLDIGHGAALVLLWPTSAVLADTHGIAVVDPTDLVHAQADPFCLMEDAWLTHLEDTHGEILARLARRLPPELRGHRVRPVAIDRFGITLRVCEEIADEAATTDVRMPFGREVHNPLQLGRAVRSLARCPRPARIVASG